MPVGMLNNIINDAALNDPWQRLDRQQTLLHITVAKDCGHVPAAFVERLNCNKRWGQRLTARTATYKRGRTAERRTLSEDQLAVPSRCQTPGSPCQLAPTPAASSPAVSVFVQLPGHEGDNPSMD